jgi:hypothetical protein
VTYVPTTITYKKRLARALFPLFELAPAVSFD